MYLLTTGFKNRLLLVLASFVTATLVLLANDQSPANDSTIQGQVTANTLTSPELRGVTLAFAAPYIYAGGQRFNLYGVAVAEQHFFVDAGPDRAVRRFVWVQFEHYLPTNNHRYRYPPAKLAKIGDLDFITDTKVMAHYFAEESNPASDSAKAKAFFKDKGYRIPEAVVRARCFYLPDSANRRELMIIYVEALSSAELDGAAIPNEESADVKFPQLAAKVIADLSKALSIRSQ